jgi:hypothetical protein
MPELANVMQRAALDRPVVDKTGLSGVRFRPGVDTR